MQFIKTFDVFKDSVTGGYYTKNYAFNPTVLVDSMDFCPTKGVYLRLHSPPDSDFSVSSTLAKRVKPGFSPQDFGQDLFVTADFFERRFIPQGKTSTLVDYEEDMKRYSEEGGNFTDHAWVAKQVFHYLKKGSGSFSDCAVYAMYSEYEKNLNSVAQKSPLQLSLF